MGGFLSVPLQAEKDYTITFTNFLFILGTFFMTSATFVQEGDS